MAELCRICSSRRPRRHCPGIESDICAPCCGTQREVNISCPLDCVFLQEARGHEHSVNVDPRSLPNQDVKLNEAFLREHQQLLVFAGFTLAEAALRTAGAVDQDVQAALAALIRTRRTAESGLVYETRADDAVAARIQDLFETSFAEFQRERAQREGGSPYRNAEVLGILVFLERASIANQNGRPKGRAYIDMLRRQLRIERLPETPSLLSQ